jgi:hypothetical protein
MRSPFRRKVAVFEDLSRPRLGEHQERRARSILRPARTVVAMGGAGFKLDGQGASPDRPTSEVRSEQ